jgi:hypothetical protein
MTFTFLTGPRPTPATETRKAPEATTFRLQDTTPFAPSFPVATVDHLVDPIGRHCSAAAVPAGLAAATAVTVVAAP